jgi:hypothetical protein
MYGRKPFDKPSPGSKEYQLNINKTNEELRRLGNLRVTAPLSMVSTPAGITLGCSPPPSSAKLYQVQNPLVYPEDQTQPPNMTGALLLKWDGTNSKYTAPDPSGDPPPPTYQLYHPMALRDTNNNYIGLPSLFTPAWVWAWSNPMSGNLEIIDDRIHAYRAQLLADLNQGSSAQAIVWENSGSADSGGTGDQEGATITVYDWYLPSGGTLTNGTRVGIQWFADDFRFYVTTAACS